ncbi:WAT1-related protein At5g47470 [Linum perenne]
MTISSILGLKKEILEDLAIAGGLIGVQFVYAGNSVLLSYLMSIGLNSLTIVIFSTFSTFLIISPFAFYFERKKWPKRLNFKLVTQLVLISFGGVTLFQTFFLKGIKLTSPALATAMPNLAPGFIFIIAWTLRLERVRIGCIYSKVKIMGTLLCVVGALTMSLMHSRSSKEAGSFISFPTDISIDMEKLVGCAYLVAAVLVLSSNVVLQAKTLGDFPAPMSLCAITSLIGVMITAVVQLLQDQTWDVFFPHVNTGELIGYSLLGGAVGGACVSFNGWAMKKRGPVLVSMFSPIGTVISVVLSVITLGDTINIGSLCGMLLMFTGLYFFLWAKGKEGYSNAESLEISGDEFDMQKPLLS